MLKRLRKGQSTMEYVIVVTAVVGAILAFILLFKPKLTATYTNLTDAAQTKVGTVVF